MVSRKSLPYTQNDVTEADARGLLDAVSVPHTAFCAPAAVNLPATFQDALKKGAPLPSQPAGNYDSRNAQLHRQQSVDKTNLARTMNQMGGQFGFRSKEK